MAILHLGDSVNSKFGPSAVKQITLVSEQWDKGESDGVPVPHIAWNLVLNGWAIVDLENGHWCYGDQITPVTQEVR